jgi:glycosyltransferase involved in cell wall biosynthesis
VRHPGGGGGGGRAAHARRASYAEQILDAPALALELSQRAARRARDYTWSTAAGRLRRVYGDITARALVDCS